eukprot:7490343-Alexandrium_andersonii.AAC.1
MPGFWRLPGARECIRVIVSWAGSFGHATARALVVGQSIKHSIASQVWPRRGTLANKLLRGPFCFRQVQNQHGE